MSDHYYDDKGPCPQEGPYMSDQDLAHELEEHEFLLDAQASMRERAAKVAEDLGARYRASADRQRELYNGRPWWLHGGGSHYLRDAATLDAAADGCASIALVIRGLKIEG